MTNAHAAHFLIEMKADIEEIKKIVSQPTETETELNTENARRRAELESAIADVIHTLRDHNLGFSARVSAAITRLEIALEDDDIPF